MLPKHDIAGQGEGLSGGVRGLSEAEIVEDKMLPKLDIATKERGQSQSETESDENRMLPAIPSAQASQVRGLSEAEIDVDMMLSKPDIATQERELSGTESNEDMMLPKHDIAGQSEGLSGGVRGLS